MNTWAFVGDLTDQPQLSCVYKSEDAQNEFLSNPKIGIGEDVYDDNRPVNNKKKLKQTPSDGQRKANEMKASELLQKDSVVN